jgi:hypothetical protein
VATPVQARGLPRLPWPPHRAARRRRVVAHRRGRKALYKEGAAVETLQSVHLLGAAAVFGAHALRARRVAGAAARWMPVILLLCVCLALVREFDFAWKRAA